MYFYRLSFFAVIIYVLHSCLGGIGVKQHGKNNGT